MLFLYSKSYFDIRTVCENAILAFKVIFWHSNWVGKCYFDIQNPISTFEVSRKIEFKILFWHSNWVGKCYFDTQNPILTFELSRKIVFKILFSLFWHSNWVGKSSTKFYFDIQTESENCILTFKILFRHSKWFGKCYFDIQNPLTFELSRKIVFKILFWLFWNSNWVGKLYFDIKNPILTFELSRNTLF